MPVRMSCECGNTFKVPDSENGKKVKCPSCKKVLVVGGVAVAAGATKGDDEASSVSSSGGKPKLKSKPSKSAKVEGGEDEFSSLERSREAAPVIQGFAKPRKKPKPEGAEPKPKKKRTNNQPPVWVMALCGLFMAGVIGGAVFVGMQANKADKVGVVAPQNFEKFAASENFFSMLKPEGFEAKTAGGTGGVPITVVFEKDSIRIEVRSDPKGASIADIAGGAQVQDDGSPESLEEAPAGKVHRFMEARMKDEYSNYEEGTMAKLKTGYGDARVSDFTSKSMFSKYYGTRVSIVGVQFQLNLIGRCKDEKTFQAYKAIFRKIAESIGSGG